MSIKEAGTPIQAQNCNTGNKQKWEVQEVTCPDFSAFENQEEEEKEKENNEKIEIK